MATKTPSVKHIYDVGAWLLPSLSSRLYRLLSFAYLLRQHPEETIWFHRLEGSWKFTDYCFFVLRFLS